MYVQRAIRCEWDENKNRNNRTKHGISFETAALVFNDPLAGSALNRVVTGEERWMTIGTVGTAVLAIVHTM